MKYILNALLLFTICLSCKKNIDPINPITPAPVDSPPENQISLSYVNTISETNQFELIITDSAASFLLDTIISTTTMHYLKVYSHQLKFNITTIDLKESNNYKIIQTFYQVKPIEWKINQDSRIGFKDSSFQNAKVEGEILYNNVPKNAQVGNFQFGNAYGAEYNGINKTVTLNYNQHLPYNSFILFTSSGLYKFNITSKVKDTVDLSVMDTAIKRLFQKSLPISSGFRKLTGFSRKNDNSSAILLYTNSFDPFLTTYDIIYPPKGIEQYLIQCLAVDKNQSVHITDLFGPTVPEAINFIDSSWYLINSSNINNFSISFPKTLPSVYSIYLNTIKINWGIHLPADKTTLKGTSEIINLAKTIRLKGQDFSTTAYSGIVLNNGDNLKYLDYYNFVFAKDAYGKNKFSVLMDF